MSLWIEMSSIASVSTSEIGSLVGVIMAGEEEVLTVSINDRNECLPRFCQRCIRIRVVVSAPVDGKIADNNSPLLLGGCEILLEPALLPLPRDLLRVGVIFPPSFPGVEHREVDVPLVE